MKPYPALLVTYAAALLATATGAAASDGRGHQVTIGPAALAPAKVDVALHERVVFVDRSRRDAHIEFHGRGGEHHVFQVPGTMWAEFHWPGVHPYVVHFSAGEPAELHGIVAVDYGPPFVPGPECGGFTVEEVCIER